MRLLVVQNLLQSHLFNSTSRNDMKKYALVLIVLFAFAVNQAYSEPLSKSLSISLETHLREFIPNKIHSIDGYVVFSSYRAPGVMIDMTVEDPNGAVFIKNSKTETDNSGNYSFSFFVPEDAELGKYTVYMNATKLGYASTEMKLYFWVIDKAEDVTELSWETKKVLRDGQEFDVSYRVTSGKVEDMESSVGSFFVYLTNYSEGFIELAIPKNLIEPDLASIYDGFEVRVNGYVQHYEETDSTCFRMFKIKLLENSSVIKIFTQPSPGPKFQSNVPEKCNDSAIYDKFTEKKPTVSIISTGTKPNISEINKLPWKFYLLNANFFYENKEWVDQTFRIPYKLDNANLEFMSYGSGKIMVVIDSKDDGIMQIAIPHAIFESKKLERTKDFSLSIDGEISDFHKTKTNCYREFTFEFPNGSNEILIMHKIQEGSRIGYVNPLGFPVECTTGHNIPSRQILSGKLPGEVDCFEPEMIPFKKLSEDKIVCITPKTAEKLLERKWGNYPTDLEKGQTWVELYPILCHENFCAIRAIWEEDYLSGKLQPVSFAGKLGYDIKTTSELIIDSYRKQGIQIFDVKFEQSNEGNCGTKDCLDLYTLKLLVNDNDLNKMNSYSFEIFEKYR